MAVLDQSPTKRILERWISVIAWLKTSNQPYQQIDEVNRPAIQLVLEALVSGARKMRQAALFVKLHRLQIKDNNLQFNETKVLVTEDGKRAKRWCLLNDATSPLLFPTQANLSLTVVNLRITLLMEGLRYQLLNFLKLIHQATMACHKKILH